MRLATQYADIAVQIGLVESTPDLDLDRCRETIKTWQENPRMTQHDPGGVRMQGVPKTRLATWLLVLDNADDANVLADFWPVTGVGSVLMTSRDPFTRTQYFYPTAGLQLGALREEEGIELLKALTSRPGARDNVDNNDAARRIVRRLGGLPLALYQIGAVIQRYGHTFSSFLAAYSRDVDYFELYDERRILRTYEHNLGSVWAFDSIKDTAAMSLLQVISMLDPEGIHENLLININKLVIAEFPMSRKTYHRALAHLLESSMVEKNLEANTLSVHRLVQDVCRARMAKTEEDTQAAFDRALHALTLQWPYTITKRQFKTGSAGKIERWGKCAELYPHIVSLCRNHEQLASIMKVEKQCLDLVDLICEAAW